MALALTDLSCNTRLGHLPQPWRSSNLSNSIPPKLGQPVAMRSRHSHLSWPSAFHSSGGSGVTSRRTERHALLETYEADNSSVELKDDRESLELVDPEFYRIGYVRHVRAYGVEFKEGHKGIGVYAAKDLTIARTGRVIMEIPMELMITVSKDLPWMFHPDIVPLGHPIFEIINSTTPETDWDLRLACLLLLALDQKDNFWHEYCDYLPAHEELTSLLLATEEELLYLQEPELQQIIITQKRRAIDFWRNHWTADVALKVKRLAHFSSQFLWALGVVWSRKFMTTMTIGAKVQDAHMLIPYADMLNHSYHPTCSYRWRKRDRILEVVLNPGQTIKQGDEMTLNYADSRSNIQFMQYYGFSCIKNPFDVITFTGDSSIHKDSFLSAFNLYGMVDDIYHKGFEEVEVVEKDGAVLTAAYTVPMWSDDDFPFLPSLEIKAANALKQECRDLLATFPTTLEEDIHILASSPGRSVRWQAALRYRMHRKYLIRRIAATLDQYMERILY